MFSIRPAPNRFAGSLKTRLLVAAAASKSGRARTQPPAPVRPVMVAVFFTPPSRLPSGLNLKWACCTGPFSLRKKGTRSVPPSFEAKATCGFTNGLVPPGEGGQGGRAAARRRTDSWGFGGGAGPAGGRRAGEAATEGGVQPGPESIGHSLGTEDLRLAFGEEAVFPGARGGGPGSWIP